MNLVIKLKGSGQLGLGSVHLSFSTFWRDVQVVLDMEISTGIRAGTIGKKMDEIYTLSL